MSFNEIEEKLKDFEIEIFSEKDHVKEEIEEIEKKYKIKLPDDYKQFLLKYGASMICDDDVFYKSLEQDTWSEDEFQVVEFFYGLEETELDLDIQDKIDTYSERFPEGIIPIASSPFGNEICLQAKGDDIGKIYFWDHEYRNSEGDFFLVANTFTDFIKSLVKKL
ncbi:MULTISPECIES: SMI1/KNR4 family protein [Bacillus]|uniref:SMI1/KNR4 family protein n=1 Tax=Bacillus TaxID=1386 RepID=UPI00227FED5E|nr:MULTISPECIES: SMI1/KNR4 family protein [Bacillus]MCY8002451.1 SMI1/KNR4 family protein [Bacillus haynesii]MCY8178850.1 SMI1/KNR4 family protein [Bacillus paralicheniformis]MCY8378429.1 SMI1/KNR4 family protein [Bacillus haynesii]MCY8611546.1 SMI1/KNR4 family protein [Bacillus haynesii]MCY9340595.1 SMI1/KNR4 family protein [Bacillus haynesii]